MSKACVWGNLLQEKQLGQCRGLQGAALRVVRVLFGACGVPVKTIEKGRNLGTKANPSKSNTCMTFVSNLGFEKH